MYRNIHLIIIDIAASKLYRCVYYDSLLLFIIFHILRDLKEDQIT